MILDNTSTLSARISPGQHAFLSPSSPAWLNYNDAKLRDVLDNAEKAALGTKLHGLAQLCIQLKQRLPNTTASINSFVNDAIGYRMYPEFVLRYTDNVFGTADSISFDGTTLRIHDLKTGASPGNMKQLLIYAALFCLSWSVDPDDITVILRIYHSDNITEETPRPENVRETMTKIIYLNDRIEAYRGELR